MLPIMNYKCSVSQNITQNTVNERKVKQKIRFTVQCKVSDLLPTFVIDVVAIWVRHKSKKEPDTSLGITNRGCFIEEN